MRKVVGLDISLDKTAVCVIDIDGTLLWQGKVDSEPGPLIDKLRAWQAEIDVVGLEACPMSEWLHRHLTAAGLMAVCVDTRHARRFLPTRTVKTDWNDARLGRDDAHQPLPARAREVARDADGPHRAAGAPAGRGPVKRDTVRLPID